MDYHTAVTNADYCFIMDDDSMEQAHIFHGDLVFVRQTTEIESGKLMAVILNGTVEIRRAWLTSGVVCFSSASPREPIFRELDDLGDVQIIGVVTETRHLL